MCEALVVVSFAILECTVAGSLGGLFGGVSDLSTLASETLIGATILGIVVACLPWLIETWVVYTYLAPLLCILAPQTGWVMFKIIPFTETWTASLGIAFFGGLHMFCMDRIYSRRRADPVDEVVEEEEHGRSTYVPIAHPNGDLVVGLELTSPVYPEERTAAI